jgi:microcystin-dependent protein
MVTATAPSGFLECDGSAVSRSTYAALFAVIGTTYGAGDGSTTFNVPDLTDKVAVG